MANRFRRFRVVLFAAIALSAIAPATAFADATWGDYPVPTPPGSLFPQPIGAPTDIQCWSENRCLLTTSGDDRSFKAGVFVFNGDKAPGVSGWRQYATVCDAAESTGSSVAWAGPTEFWTITAPSDPLFLSLNIGLSLCHFKDGQVVGSYSTKRSATFEGPDPFRRMTAGACIAANNCWFGGVAAARPNGETPGSFHLHWDGSELKTIYAPAKRGVADIAPFGDGLAEAVYSGPNSSGDANPDLGDPPPFRPIQLIAQPAVDANGFSDGTLVPQPVTGLTGDVTEVLAIDDGLPSAPGPMLWAVGGGAASGAGRDNDPDPFAIGDDSPADRGPFAAYRDPVGAWHELPVPTGDTGYAPNTRFVDVAAIPGTHKAIAAVRPENLATQTPAQSDVALLDADAGTVEPQTVSFSGSVERVECANAHDCWAVTAEGLLLRLSDAALPPVALDTEPAFNTTVTFRPNEVAEQQISDSPPPDDSLLFAPPPAVETPEQGQGRRTRLKSAVQGVKSKLKGHTLKLTFRVIRPARVTITAKRHKKVVAQTKSKLLRKGKHTLSLRLNPKKWPTKIDMKVAEPK
ncbi:MAG: hypothetical protein ACRDKI_10550 [Solirubrobacterales bacterium]